MRWPFNRSRQSEADERTDKFPGNPMEFSAPDGLFAAGVLGTYHSLERRIITLSRVRRASRRRTWVALGLLLLLAAVALPAWQLVPQQASEQDKTDDGVVLRLGETYRFGTARSLAFTPDGKTLITCMSNAITYWDAESGVKLRSHTLPEQASVMSKAVDVSPDGKHVAIAGATYVDKQPQGYVCVLDVASGDQLFRQTLPKAERVREQYYNSVAFSPDGKQLLAGAYTGEVTLWNLETGQQQRQWQTPGPEMDATTNEHPVAFSRDGTLIASGGYDNMLRVFDLRSRDDAPLWETKVKSTAIVFVAFLADGRIISRSSPWTNGNDYKGRFHIWNGQTGELIQLVGADEATGTGAAKLSPDGSRLAVVDQKKIQIYDTETWQALVDLSESNDLWLVDSPYHLAFSPGGERLVARGADWNVRMWDVLTGGELLVKSGQHTSAIRGADVSPDGKMLLTLDENLFRLWDAATGKPLRTVMFNDPRGTTRNMMQCGFTPDGTGVVFCGGVRTGAMKSAQGVLEIWDVSTGRLRYSLPGLPYYATSMAFSTDGKAVAVTAGVSGYVPPGEPVGVYVFSLENGGLLAKSTTVDRQAALEVMLTFDNQQGVVESLGEGVITTWDLRSGQIKGTRTGEFQELPGWNFIAMAKGNWLMQDADRKSLKLFDPHAERILRAFDADQSAVDSVCFSRDGRFMAARCTPRPGQRNWVRVWEFETGRVVRDFRNLPDDVFYRPLAFFPDGNRLLGGLYDSTAAVLDFSAAAAALDNN